jgi:CheY-like chemotaxis protein
MYKILLVEDDEIMARMYKRLFKYKGYKIEIAKDGREGLVKVRNFDPDLILLDVMIPHLNGIEVLGKLKSNTKTKHIPIILLTNLGIQEELDKAVKIGIVRYIIKNDHTPEEVFKIAKDVLEKSSLK